MNASLVSLDAYLALLPAGMASYPEALVKGSALLSLLEHPGFADLDRDARVPEAARRLVCEPPTATSWIAEVHFNALLASFYDVAFRDCGGIPAYEAWVAAQNQKMLQTPLYRALFVVMSPERLFAATAHRWKAFRRGSVLSVVRGERGAADLQLVSPPYLEPPCMLHGISGAFRAAVRAAGGSVLSVQWVERSPSTVVWSVRWK